METYNKIWVLVGVVVAGRPVARGLDDGFTCEVTRCCADGTKNACSMLYGAAARAARAMGYTKIVTYTLPQEGGSSIRGAGWIEVATTKGNRTWDTLSRHRKAIKQDPKTRWEKRL